MKVYVDLTENEIRALSMALLNGLKSCQSTCVYEEMKTKTTDCIDCPYFNGLGSLRRKFSNMKSLSDYTKQLRKEVCEEIKKKADIKYYEEYDGFDRKIGKTYIIRDYDLD